jgi:azurin
VVLLRETCAHFELIFAKDATTPHDIVKVATHTKTLAASGEQSSVTFSPKGESRLPPVCCTFAPGTENTQMIAYGHLEST